jgi:hypothetical protein
MKKEESSHQKFDSLSGLHQAFGLPKPMHPLISLIDIKKNLDEVNKLPHSHVLSFYKISYKTKISGKIKYGQDYYDFDEGGLLFASPGQVIGSNGDNAEPSGHVLLIHPDFLLTYPLAKKIKQYGFFSYSANEALHLSDKEKATIMSIFKIIEDELNSRIDDFSQDIVKE